MSRFRLPPWSLATVIVLVVSNSLLADWKVDPSKISHLSPEAQKLIQDYWVKSRRLRDEYRGLSYSGRVQESKRRSVETELEIVEDYTGHVKFQGDHARIEFDHGDGTVLGVINSEAFCLLERPRKSSDYLLRMHGQIVDGESEISFRAKQYVYRAMWHSAVGAGSDLFYSVSDEAAPSGYGAFRLSLIRQTDLDGIPIVEVRGTIGYENGMMSEYSGRILFESWARLDWIEVSAAQKPEEVEVRMDRNTFIDPRAPIPLLKTADSWGGGLDTKRLSVDPVAIPFDELLPQVRVNVSSHVEFENVDLRDPDPAEFDVQATLSRFSPIGRVKDPQRVSLTFMIASTILLLVGLLLLRKKRPHKVPSESHPAATIPVPPAQ